MATIVPVPLNYSQEPYFQFEQDFNDGPEFGQWLKRKWYIPVGSATLYVITIFALQKFMKNRKPFDLRPALVLWSAILAVFSIIGASKTVPERLYILANFGWEYSVCERLPYTGPIAYWSYLFTISKVYELGDTLFIILRKQKLIFLHWYHHITVLLYTWYSYAEQQSLGRWFIIMNYTVHAVMYTYYTLRALKVQVPRPAAMCVTILQISQMVVGVITSFSAFYFLTDGHPCETKYSYLSVTFGIYFSYFLLFAHFFCKSYFKSKPNSKNEAKKIS